MLFCRFCLKECKSGNSLRNHERLCSANPARQFTVFSNSEFRSTKKKSNGSIKAKEEGREFCVSAVTRKKLSQLNLARSDEWNKENGRRISKTVAEKVQRGEWHTSLAKKMHIDYNGIDLHGSWELAYATYLDANNIKWIRCRDSFEYEFEGKVRRYTPDFYLIDLDEYVEVKGYKTEKDTAKWNQFPTDKKLLVLLKENLLSLGIKIKI